MQPTADHERTFALWRAGQARGKRCRRLRLGCRVATCMRQPPDEGRCVPCRDEPQQPAKQSADRSRPASGLVRVQEIFFPSLYPDGFGVRHAERRFQLVESCQFVPVNLDPVRRRTLSGRCSRARKATTRKFNHALAHTHRG